MPGAIHEQVAVVGRIDPDAYATGDQTSTVIDMMYWREILIVVQAGTLGSSATLDCVVKGDTASNGSFATTITGKSITQLTQAGTDSDKDVVISVSAEDVAAQGFRYVRATMTVGVAGSDAGAIILGWRSRYAPVGDFDLTTVDEIVN